MNEYHEICGSDEWRALMRDSILPWAVGDVDLGDDVLEVGAGYGATTDVLCERPGRVTSVEIDGTLAAFLQARFTSKPNVTIVHGDATALEFPDGRFTGAVSFTMLHHVPTGELQDRLFGEVGRVLRPGAAFVASDGVYDAQVESAHEGDTYNPIDPATLPGRLGAAGFSTVDIMTNEFGWSVVATRDDR